jgi:hypothetical protein
MQREERFRRLQKLGCICCLIEGLGYVPPDIHHLVDNGYRELSGGDTATIPLDPWHHRGQPPSGMSVEDALFHAGPSLALHKKRFLSTYGNERELLAEVDRRIGAVA